MRQATAWACVTLIADACAMMPKMVLRREDKSRTEVRTPRFRALWGKPNPDSLPATFWNAQFLALAVRGNAYAWRDDPNLWFLHPSRITVGPDERGRKQYILDREKPIASEQILHFVGESENGVTGVSTVEVAARTIDSARNAELFAANALGRGAIPVGVLSSEQILSPVEVEEIKKRWAENYGGAGNVGDIAVLGKGAKFEPINFTHEQLQFLESRQFARDEIAQLWRVPPHLIGLTEKPSAWGTGVESLSIAFVRYTLMPWIVRAEQAITYDLLPENMVYRFVVQSLERADLQARFESYKKGREMGVFSADEIRELEDMRPREVPDDYLNPVNMERLNPQRAGAMAAQPAIAAIAGAIRDFEMTQRIGETPFAIEVEDMTETERMAQAFLDGQSYGQVAIQFGIDGADPTAAVKMRLRRHFKGSPNEARRLYLEGLEEQEPPKALPARTTKIIERDEQGRIARVIEEIDA